MEEVWFVRGSFRGETPCASCLAFLISEKSFLGTNPITIKKCFWNLKIFFFSILNSFLIKDQRKNASVSVSN